MQVYVQRIVESGCWGQLSCRGAYTSGWTVSAWRSRSVLCWLWASSCGCWLGWAVRATAVACVRLAWKASFSVERHFQRGASVSAWKVGSMLKLSISVELAKKESAWGFNPISVSAWSSSFSKETKCESFSVEPCTVSAWR